MKTIETAIREVLSDGNWHAVDEICRIVSPVVPQESAMRQLLRQRKGKIDDDKLTTTLIEARWQKVKHAIPKLAFHLRHRGYQERVEHRGPTGNREYRLVTGEESHE